MQNERRKGGGGDAYANFTLRDASSKKNETEREKKEEEGNKLIKLLGERKKRGKILPIQAAQAFFKARKSFPSPILPFSLVL